MKTIMHRVLMTLTLAITALFVNMAPAQATTASAEPVSPQRKDATPAVQVDAQGARFELLGDGRWKLTIPGDVNNADGAVASAGWVTPTDCYGYFYGVSHSIAPEGMNWGGEQTCDRPQIHYPHHLDLWLQARCTAWSCWFVDEDHERTPYSEDYTRVVRAWGFTPCQDASSRNFRIKVYPTVNGNRYGPYYSDVTGTYYCGV